MSISVEQISDSKEKGFVEASKAAFSKIIDLPEKTVSDVDSHRPDAE